MEKYCKDCKHCVDGGDRFSKCLRNAEIAIHRISGEKTYENYSWCTHEREVDYEVPRILWFNRVCGKEGKYWEAK